MLSRKEKLSRSVQRPAKNFVGLLKTKLDHSDESNSNGLIPGTPQVVDSKEDPSQDGFNEEYQGQEDEIRLKLHEVQNRRGTDTSETNTRTAQNMANTESIDQKTPISSRYHRDQDDGPMCFIEPESE